MKKLGKLKLEEGSLSTLESLGKDQMAKFTGGTTYGSCYTFTVYPDPNKSQADGADAVD
jgi:hypothetical protein